MRPCMSAFIEAKTYLPRITGITFSPHKPSLLRALSRLAGFQLCFNMLIGKCNNCIEKIKLDQGYINFFQDPVTVKLGGMD